MLEIRNVTMAYGADPVVKDVSLDFERSEITALIGPNGAGKSTLLGGIGRLQKIRSGRILLDGRSIDAWKSDLFARRVAVLRQENHITVRLTVAELVALGRHPHTKGRLTREDHAQIDDALACVDMTPFAGRYLDELSGGQRQRAFIAMTLAQNSDYLLLDEPLSSLDMRHSRNMMRHLTRVVSERGIAVVIVIHDINTAAAYANRLVALRDGELIADGTPEEIMCPSTLERVFQVPVDVTTLGGHPVAFAKR